MEKQKIQDLKEELIAQCRAIQNKNVNTAHEAMLASQESANEQKGTMGDKFESFREQMQIDRDMYARQYTEGLQVLQEISKINPSAELHVAALGAIVDTDVQPFFISASLGQISIGDKKYMAISTQSPLFKAMAGKKAGDSFQFRERKYLIKAIY